MAIHQRIFALFMCFQSMLGTPDSSSNSSDALIVNHLEEHDAQPRKAQEAWPTTQVAGATIFTLSRPQPSLLPEMATSVAGARAMDL